MARNFLLEQSRGFRKVLQLEDGKARVTYQEYCEPILELNQNAQKDFERSMLHTKWAIPILRVPIIKYKELIANNPDLRDPDSEKRTIAWMKVAKNRDDIRTVPKKYVPSGNRFDLK